jgi:aspartate racemase
MRTVGIIGGLGPETTAHFYLKVIFSSFEKNKEFRPAMLVWNVPLPYKIEEEFITKAQGEEKYLPFLIDAAQRLEKGGADFIVIPCNSVHIFIDEVRKAVNIPVLSVIDETIYFLKEKNIKDVGILATSATIRKKLYEEKLLENDIHVKLPDDDDQSRMGSIINHLVHSRHTDQDKIELIKIIEKLSKKEVKTLILACTDLQLLVPEFKDMKIYDTMEILAEATVRELLK